MGKSKRDATIQSICRTKGCNNFQGKRGKRYKYDVQTYNLECTSCTSKQVVKYPKYGNYIKLDYCESCGFKAENRCQLDVDHVSGDHLDNSNKNLQTLCSNCHRLKTWRNRDNIKKKKHKKKKQENESVSQKESDQVNSFLYSIEKMMDPNPSFYSHEQNDYLDKQLYSLIIENQELAKDLGFSIQTIKYHQDKTSFHKNYSLMIARKWAKITKKGTFVRKGNGLHRSYRYDFKPASRALGEVLQSTRTDITLADVIDVESTDIWPTAVPLRPMLSYLEDAKDELIKMAATQTPLEPYTKEDYYEYDDEYDYEWEV